jgi:hypothetical protein
MIQSVVSEIRETLIQVFLVWFYRPMFVLDLQAVDCTVKPASSKKVKLSL